MKKDIFIKCAIITFIALTICVIIAVSTMTGNIIYEPQHDTLHLTKLIPTLFVNIVAALVTSAIISGVLSKSVSGKYSNALYSENINKADTEEASVEEMSADIQDALDHLRYERNKIEYILDNMSEGLVLISSDKTVRTLNSAAQRVLGCDERENGKSIDCYTNNLNIIEGVDKCIADKEKVVFDIQTENKRIYAVYITRILRGVLNDTQTGAAILMIDVTENRNAQKMRQEFFSNVSHEMKTPITSIRGFVDLMESGLVTDEEQKKEYLSRIKKEMDNMTNLINDILMISRLETQDITKTDIEINLTDIVEEVCRSVEPMVKCAELTMKFECEEVCAKIDMPHMRQLANNLITNAVKYNKNGGKVIVRLHENNNKIFFEVEDTGIGIPPEAHARIFERFYRVDKGRSRTMGGTGLGLSIVKHIVQFYDGTVEINSKMGEGTRMTVRIPM